MERGDSYKTVALAVELMKIVCFLGMKQTIFFKNANSGKLVVIVEDYTSKNVWAAQIGLIRKKENIKGVLIWGISKGKWI